jgi:hypothetical protein
MSVADDAFGSSPAMSESHSNIICTALLEIAYQESGPPTGPPVVLLHGFPDDTHAYDDVAPQLASAAYRVSEDTAQPGSSILQHRVPANRRRSAVISWT